MSLSPGSRVGPYEILCLLGKGGMGEVYKARDTRLDRPVALKLLLGETTDESRARLLHEATSAAALNHPHICAVYDVGEHEGTAFVALEYIDGQALGDLVPREGLPRDRALRYALQIADGLAHAHDRGVVHRDLKAANVMIGSDGRARILDFGIARRLDPTAVADATRSAVAELSVVSGTPAYLSPEALRGEAVDARSDIWAFGVLLFEMLSGERPFAGRTVFEISSAVLREPAPGLPSRVPAGLRIIVARCLAKEPSERYQRAGELRAALEALQTRPAPPTRPGRARQARALRPVVTTPSTGAGRSGRPVAASAEGYSAYLKGRHCLQLWTDESLRKAIAHFEEAIRRDPAWPLPHAGLAEAYVWQLAGLAARKSQDTAAKARASAQRALELDPRLAAAHVSLALVATYHDWDCEAAERHFGRALESKPDYAEAHVWYAWYLTCLQAKFDDALRELDCAERLDPLSSQWHGRWLVHYFREEFDAAIVEARRALDIDPNRALAHYDIGLAFTARGRHEDAIASLETATRLGGRSVNNVGELATAHARAGHRDRAEELLAELLDTSRQGYVASPWIATIHTALGDADAAFKWLDRAVRERAGELIYLLSPEFRALRQDTRFAALLRKMGLGHLVAVVALTNGTTAAVATSPEQASIAVLPFDNLSSDPEQEYFCDGMTDEIITALSKIRGLRVISRNSAMALKGTRRNARETGAMLNVGHVLEGSVRKAGSSVRINAQLVDAATDAHVWAERYSGTLDEVFAIQDNVAAAIADALKVTLGPAERLDVRPRSIADERAQDCYRRAWREMGDGTASGFDRAVRLVTWGLETLGDHPTLLVAMAQIHYLALDWNLEPCSELLAIAVDYTRRVEAATPDRAPCLLAKLERFTGSLERSMRHFEEAVRRDPADTASLWFLSHTYSFHAGKPAAGRAVAKRLLSIDPLTALNSLDEWAASWAEGDFGRALEAVHEMGRIDPGQTFVSLFRPQTLARLGQLDEALREAEADAARNHPLSAWSVGLAHALRGECDALIALVNQHAHGILWTDADPDSPPLTAGWFALAGDREHALDWLERWVNRGSFNYPLLAHGDPLLESLRGERRFKRLLERVRPVWETFVPLFEPPDQR